MTSGDLLILAPWLVFGAGLVIIGFKLWKSRRTPRHPAPGPRPQRPQQPPPGQPPRPSHHD